MFKLFDGRVELYQWDLDRKVIVSDPTIHEVHFCNKESKHSLVTAVYELDGQRVADIPNILLQDIWPIKAYGQCGECYVKAATTFNLVRRAQPDDYIYTETDVYRVEDVVAQMLVELQEEIIKNTTDKVEEIVETTVDAAVGAAAKIINAEIDTINKDINALKQKDKALDTAIDNLQKTDHTLNQLSIELDKRTSIWYAQDPNEKTPLFENFGFDTSSFTFEEIPYVPDLNTTYEIVRDDTTYSFKWAEFDIEGETVLVPDFMINGEYLSTEFDFVVAIVPTFGQMLITQYDGGAHIYSLYQLGCRKLPEIYLPMDDALDLESKRPVQNKVVAAAIGDISSALDAILAKQNAVIGGA